MSDPIAPKALKPNPALQALEFIVGEWRTEGTHPLIAGQTLNGRTSFAWHEGGAFLMMRAEVDHPLFPDGIAIIGSDKDSGRVAMSYFDERGFSRLFEVEIGERQVTWRRDDAHLAQSLTLAADDNDRLTSRGRMSENRGPWGEDLSQVFTRDPG
jgi:hypothetical protein